MYIDKQLTDALVSSKLLTDAQAQEVTFSALNTGMPIEDILLKRRMVTPDDIYHAKAKVYAVPFVTLVGRGISPDVLSFIPEPVAKKYLVFPFDVDKKTGKLFVAMKDPLDLPLIEFLEQKSGKSVTAYLAKEDEIRDKITEEYAQGLTVEVTEALKETGESRVRTIEVDKLGQIIKEAPIAKIVSTILEYAVKSRASDIHIEPQELKTRVRYRIDGILHEKLALPRSVHDAVISRVKILSGMKIDERRLPQDGRFNFKIVAEEVDLRVSTLPTVHGEKVVIRLLKKTGGIPQLSELGLRGPTLKNLEASIARPHGIILITGPTGSGKTTTLYSILSRLNTGRVNIITLEDPIEYELPGINQVQVNPLAGLTFASGLRSFLRQDPNIILVGEIRDNETTALAIQAALTGHLVFSTLHTNNASTAIPRLLDLGAEPFLIVSALTAVGAQRITRKICSSCKETYTPSPVIIGDFKIVLGSLYNSFWASHPGIQPLLYRGKGCKECNGTGYLGRVGIFETLMVSPTIMKLILERASAEVLEEKSVEEGMISMKQDGYLKVLEGATTIEEVLRVAQQ